MTDEDEELDLKQVIASACRVVAASDDIGAITITVNRRLTYEELVLLRDHAAPCHVTIAKDRHWTFRVRRPGATRQLPSARRSPGEHTQGSGHAGAHGVRSSGTQCRSGTAA